MDVGRVAGYIEFDSIVCWRIWYLWAGSPNRYAHWYCSSASENAQILPESPCSCVTGRHRCHANFRHHAKQNVRPFHLDNCRVAGLNQRRPNGNRTMELACMMIEWSRSWLRATARALPHRHTLIKSAGHVASLLLFGIAEMRAHSALYLRYFRHSAISDIM